MVPIAIAMAVAAAGALTPAAHAPLSLEEVQAVERLYGSGIPWPGHAMPLEQYDRFYWRDRKDPAILRGQFKKAGDRRGTIRLVSADAYHYVFDGGCDIVNLYYFGANDPRTRLACGGR